MSTLSIITFKQSLAWMATGQLSRRAHMLVGDAGMGKTQAARAFVEYMARNTGEPFGFLEFRGTQSSHHDVAGLMYVDPKKQQTIPFLPASIPLDEWVEKKFLPANGTFIIEELKDADPMTKGSLYGILAEREVATRKLADGWSIFAVSNKCSSKGLAKPDPATIVNRTGRAEIEFSLDQFLTWARSTSREAINSELFAELDDLFGGRNILDIRSEHDELVKVLPPIHPILANWCQHANKIATSSLKAAHPLISWSPEGHIPDAPFLTPRSLQYMSDDLIAWQCLTGQDITQAPLFLMSAWMGVPMAADLKNFLEMFGQVPEFEDMIKGAAMPPLDQKNSAGLWIAVCTKIMEACKGTTTVDTPAAWEKACREGRDRFDQLKPVWAQIPAEYQAIIICGIDGFHFGLKKRGMLQMELITTSKLGAAWALQNKHLL